MSKNLAVSLARRARTSIAAAACIVVASGAGAIEFNDPAVDASASVPCNLSLARDPGTMQSKSVFAPVPPRPCTVVEPPPTVVEYYNGDLDNYFVTADEIEQEMVDSGAVGNWQ